MCYSLWYTAPTMLPAGSLEVHFLATCRQHCIVLYCIVLYCIVFIVRSLDLYKAKSPLDIELVNTVTHSLMLLKMGGINARNMLS